MKVLVLSARSRYQQFAPADSAAYRACKMVFCDREASEETWLAAGRDAEALVVTPVTPVRAELIEQMPRLKLIHSEGVGFDRIDLEAARQRGIYVCNNAGCNAEPVAEHAVMLMTMLLHRALWGQRMMLEGRQGEAVRCLEEDVPQDLGAVSVGLVGFGAIGQATAKRLKVSGAEIFYTARTRRDPALEAELGAVWLPLPQLVTRCDIVSLHLPAAADSFHLVDRAFLAAMKPGAYLVNTARGAIIDNEALCAAVRSGHLAGVGLDAYEPEPVPADHPLVCLARDYPDRVILCPHQGGISLSAFRRLYGMLFDNLGRLQEGQRPLRIVNGL